eukprot:jgi/Mesvir1/13918/Mv16040-RA.1
MVGKQQLVTTTTSGDVGAATIASILSRGKLKCGVGLDSPIFGMPINPQNINAGIGPGMDTDVCRAVAGAIFGAPELGSIDDRIEFVRLTWADRPLRLLDGTVDVVMRQMTYTVGRDINWNITFTTPYFYDGQGLLLRAGDFVSTTSELNVPGKRVCAPRATTSGQNAIAAMPLASHIEVENDQEGVDLLRSGMCDAYTMDKSVLAGYVSEDLVIAGQTFSREPLCAGTKDATTVDEAEFSSLVAWVVYGLMLAERNGITQLSVVTSGNFSSLNAEARRLLAIDGFNTTGFSVRPDFMADALAVVGNLGEIYARSAERFIPRANSENELWTRASGLWYPKQWSGAVRPSNYSFTATPDTLATVRARGQLRCGVRGTSFLFSLDTDGIWTGFDVDFCRAIAAVVFNDSTPDDKINFVALQDAERFIALASGRVDVLIRQVTETVGRDVALGTQAVTIFFDGQGFIVPDRSNITAASQLDVPGGKYCVLPDTTSQVNAVNYFKHAVGVAVPDRSARTIQDAFNTGKCSSFTSDKSILVESKAYGGVILPDTISREPLGPLTRDADPQWTSLVTWVVHTLLLAEAYGITAANVETFQSTMAEPLRVLGLVSTEGLPYPARNNVAMIKAVGNYGEIYARSIQAYIPRAGTDNALWLQGGLMYPYVFNGALLPVDRSPPPPPDSAANGAYAWSLSLLLVAGLLGLALL